MGYAFTCETLGSNAVKGTSTPDIGISTTNSPFSDVQIAFGLSAGENANITFDPASMTFNIGEAATDQTAGLITSWGQGTCGGTSCSMAPLVSQTGSLWWAINARQSGGNDYADAVCPSLDTIKTYAAPPNATTLTAD